jgi:glutamate-5-semialdehyde dehydrogenase
MTVVQATTDIRTTIHRLGEQAREAARRLARASTHAKNSALQAAAAGLRRDVQAIITANGRDMAAGRAQGLTAAQLDRLKLDAARIDAMARGLEEVASLPDPVGATIARWTRPNGLDISRVRVPLGVIGIIYESRPNVTADAAGLCLKSGNAAILRPGSESHASSSAIMESLRKAITSAGLPADAVQIVPTTDRTAVGEMLAMAEYIDVIVPRGGKSLIERVIAESRIPVIKHLDGNCHVYVHAGADLAMARKIVFNAKLRRTGICGAAETLLVDAAVADRYLPPILGDLIQGGCEIRGDETTLALEPRAIPAQPSDWDTEFLDAIIAVRVVQGLDEAIAHIERHGSHHTDSIVTADAAAAERFLAEIDSAIVLHNASTQFADGGEFGMGAEIGISTGKLHARGPVGVEQLTSYKYVVHGSGQVRP